MYDITEARQKFARRLEIKLTSSDGDHSIVQKLNQVLNPFREGSCPIWIDYTRDDVMAKISLSDDWKVQP